MTELLDPAAVEELITDDETRAGRRAQARQTLGVTGDEASPPLRPILREAGLGLYPMTALGILSVVDLFQSEAFTILTPDISAALGASLGAIAAARTVAFLAIIGAPLPFAALAQKRGRRAAICIVTGIVWSVVTLFTGFVPGLLALLVVLVLDGMSTGSVAALHAPLLVDSYPPAARVRVLSGYNAIKTLGQVAAPLIVSLLAGPLGLTWRGIFLALGALSLAGTIASFGLRDPGPGKFDTEALRAAEHERLGGTPAATAGVDGEGYDTDLGFFEIVRRVLLIPTVRRLSTGYFAIGVLLVPYATYQSAFLEVRWNLDASGRGLFYAAISAINVVALVAFGGWAEKRFRANPSWLVSFAGIVLIVAVAFIALGALMPYFALMFLCFAAGGAMVSVVTPGFQAALLSVIDARYRPHAAAVVGMFAAGGSILGVIFLSGLDKRLGLQGAIASLFVPGLAAGLIVRSARTLIDRDLDRMIDEVLESEDISIIRKTGGHLPMLRCSNVNFSYGQLQVLFDVDFTVDDGEMVALLGTNGAGKSTLLKVVSGIGLPSSGSVRFQGEDITYLDAERRVHMGITQIPGGRAVFGPMDVVENLRVFGYALGRDKRKIDEAIDMCLEAFPRLGERRSSLAATLSGGEQQMLGLSRALILQPRLLLIDELSLGLAPVIVGQLLDMVRRINAQGTAVVLVEQSVNIALSLVDHAYFMEKGQMRFDGPSDELLERGDLLRAVFLDGAESAATP